MGRNGKLKILFVEDMEADFEIAENVLLKNDILFESVRVDKSREFEKALAEFSPDIVISDYSMPQFNGMEALKISKNHDDSLPFIILTGTQNEDVAVDCIKSGANDYVIKEHIAKLPFAVREAVTLRDTMREKILTEKALFESELRYRSIFEKNRVVMLLVDPVHGTVADANPAASEFLGYEKNNLIGKHLSEITLSSPDLVRDRGNLIVNDRLDNFQSKAKLSSGRIRDIEVYSSPVTYLGKKMVHLIVQDITDRNRAIDALNESLNDKRDLIREIYHRTKNSMQIIISMLSLQSIFTEDKKIEKILKDMENRIRAMSLVHDKLYQSRNLSKISFNVYLSELIGNIMSGYGISTDRIKIIYIMEDVDVLIDTAIPCGLVVNELVSNIAEHAFPGNRQGILEVRLSKTKNGEIELILSDNGVGVNINIYFDNPKSIGFQIVRNIVDYQLKGTIEASGSEGVRWMLRFADNVYEERV